MSAGKIIAYIAAAILILFGVLFIWATFSPQGQIGWLIIGVISVGIGLAIIYLATRSGAGEQGAAGDGVTYKIDLSGDVNLDSLQCQNCGGTLSSENITMAAGAPIVSCPYCLTTYQLTEEPKW